MTVLFLKGQWHSVLFFNRIELFLVKNPIVEKMGEGDYDNLWLIKYIFLKKVFILCQK